MSHDLIVRLHRYSRHEVLSSVLTDLIPASTSWQFVVYGLFPLMTLEKTRIMVQTWPSDPNSSFLDHKIWTANNQISRKFLEESRDNPVRTTPHPRFLEYASKRAFGSLCLAYAELLTYSVLAWCWRTTQKTAFLKSYILIRSVILPFNKLYLYY